MKKLSLLILILGFISCNEQNKDNRVNPIKGEKFTINTFIYDEDPFRTDTIIILGIKEGYYQYLILSGYREGQIHSWRIKSDAYILRPIK